MENAVSVQTAELLYSALMGIAMGVLFDVFRVVRAFMPPKRKITVISDILYWISAIILLLTFVLTVCGGKMRWYVLFGVFCGGFVYMSSLSEIVFSVMKTIIGTVKKMLGLISKPLYLLLKAVHNKISSAIKKAEKCIRKRHDELRKDSKNGNKKKKKSRDNP